MSRHAQETPSDDRPPGPIEGPSAWFGPDMAASDAWLHTLSGAEIGELEVACGAVGARGLDLMAIGREEFPLPMLGPRLDDIRHELLDGRGFTVLRGLPVERYSIEQAATIYWGLGAYFGKPVSQNGKGHLLGHVIDLGFEPDDPKVRIYQTTDRQYFHTDSCDIVALLCLKTAEKGGLLSLVSSVTVYNEMARRRPDLAEVMFQPFEVDRRGEVPEGGKEYFPIATFHWHEGRLSTRYVRRYIESARRLDEVPPLTESQVAALDLFDELTNDSALKIDIEFKPGDMQFLHNHQILHDRTAFTDWEDPAEKRHLLRLWLCPPDGRPLPEAFAGNYGSVEIANRGGIRAPGMVLQAPLEAS